MTGRCLSQTRVERVQTRLTGYFLILGSAVCFGSYGVWSRLLGADFGIFYQGWVRSALILLLLLPFVYKQRRRFRPIAPEEKKWFIATLIFTVFTQAPLYFAFNHMALGTATVIFYGFFLVTSYLIGWGFLKEKMTHLKLLSLILTFVGLFVTFGFSLALFSLGALLLAALNGVASGGEIATTKRVHTSSLQIIFWSWIFILLTHLPLSLFLGEAQIVPAWNVQWLAMLGYALSGLGGFWLIVEGFKHVDASIGGLIGLTEIPFSVLFGICFFHDPLTSGMITGGTIILLAAMLPDLVSLRKRQKEKPPLPPPH
jgi:drug/metabolite transporter (DMT)-like permease